MAAGSADGESEGERRAARPARALVALCALLAGLAVAIALGSGEGPDATPEGLHLAGSDVGGLDAGALSARVEALAEAFDRRELVLVVGGREVRVVAGELGVKLDRAGTLDQLRSNATIRGLGALARRLARTRTDVAWELSLEPAAIEERAPTWEVALVDELPFDGEVTLDGPEPVARRPRAGRRIDRVALTGALLAALRTGAKAPVPVPLVDVAPRLTAEAVEHAAREARAILAGPVTLHYAPTDEEVARATVERQEAERLRKDEEVRARKQLPKSKRRMRRKGRRFVEEAPPTTSALPSIPEPMEIVFSRADLAAALRIGRVDEEPPRLRVELDEGAVRTKLAPFVAKLFDAARDARFEIDASLQVKLVPSRPGSRVVVERLAESVLAAANAPDRRAPLPVDREARPRFTTEAAAALNIKELVAEYTTFHPCCQPRVANIHRIADMLDGTIVKPGETLSVNAVVGPRTLARGFVVAPSIGDGEMVETPGGGVSQYATTLFNALFDGGYVIKERQPHSFYFARYPMGIEATLSWPSPDLVVYNDTKSAILVRNEYDDRRIRVRLFGDREGRRVERRVSSPFDVTEPRVEYEADPEREPDDEKVVDKGSNGFSVAVTRVVHLATGDKREERRTIRYKAKPRLVRVHPCKIPKGEPGHTGERCPELSTLDNAGDGGGMMRP